MNKEMIFNQYARREENIFRTSMPVDVRHYIYHPLMDMGKLYLYWMLINRFNPHEMTLHSSVAWLAVNCNKESEIYRPRRMRLVAEGGESNETN